MSSQSATDTEGFGLLRAFGKLRGGTEKSMTARAQAAKRATESPRQAPHAAEARSSVRQDGLEAWPLPGLAPMTRVRTSFGDVPAAALRKGDAVLTRTGEYKKIVWLNRVHLDAQLLAEKQDSNPIVIAARALAGRLPVAEVMLSPRQIIAADEDNGLNRDREAAMLLSRNGVRRLHETGLSYTLFHVGEPAAVCVEGLYLCCSPDR